MIEENTIKLSIPENRQILSMLHEINKKIDKLEKRTSTPFEILPEVCSGSQIRKALKIGHERFRQLLIKGLEDIAGSITHPRYRKSQLIEILEKNKHVFS